jgi:23S rRNA pseudouridine955/2504/2580 synthase
MDRLNLVITESDSGTRLDRFLRRHHPGVNQGRIEKLLRGGVIRVDGNKAKSSFRLEAGMEVSMPKTIIAPDADIPTKKKVSADPETVEIVREALIARGEGWLVLNKPPGLATQGGSGIKHHVDGALAEAFPEYEKCRLVHRLDRDTSGILVIATDLDMSRRLAKGFQRHDHEKIYLALVLGAPKIQQGKITAPLKKSGGKDREKVVVDETGQSAITFYRVLEQMAGRISLVVMRPETGRTHQLRAHMAHLGCPILGDGKYGGADAFPNKSIQRLCLHATSIFLDTGDGERKQVTAPLHIDMQKTFEFFGFVSSRALDLAADPDCLKGESP